MGRILEKREKEEVNLLLDKVTSLAEQIEEKGIPFSVLITAQTMLNYPSLSMLLGYQKMFSL